MSIEILTPDGFKPFRGITQKSTTRVPLTVLFHDGTLVDCTADHKFWIGPREDDTIAAENLNEGYVLNGKRVVQIQRNSAAQTETFYDPVEVDGHIYVHDGGLISHNCSFIGTGSTLIEGAALLRLGAVNPLVEENNVKIYKHPVKGENKGDNHEYILAADVGRGKSQDYSTFSIIDVSVKPFEQVAVFRNNTISPLLFPDVIFKYAKRYNDAYVIIEANDQGSVVANGLYYDLEYENMFLESSIKSNAIGLTTTKKTKRIGCSNLKDMIETGKLNIVDATTIMELSTFEAKGTSYEASEGNHDDLVMSLVIFAWFAATDVFAQMADIDLKSMLYSERLTLIEDDVTPVGFFSAVETFKDKYEVIGKDIWQNVPN